MGGRSALRISILDVCPRTGTQDGCALDPLRCQGLLISAIRDNDPVMFFEHKILYDMEGEVPEHNYTIPIGVADVNVKQRHKNGNDSAYRSFLARRPRKARQRWVNIEVVDLRSLSPKDEDAILDSVKKTHRLIVVDEDDPRCTWPRTW